MKIANENNREVKNHRFFLEKGIFHFEKAKKNAIFYQMAFNARVYEISIDLRALFLRILLFNNVKLSAILI